MKDTTAPDNQTDTAAGGWRGADYQVMVRGADSGSGLNDVQWRVNGGAITSGASPLQAVVTGNGIQTLETRVRDVAGNASAWRSETIRIDKVMPTNTTTAPLPSNPNPYSVSVTGTDADSGINYDGKKLRLSLICCTMNVPPPHLSFRAKRFGSGLSWELSRSEKSATHHGRSIDSVFDIVNLSAGSYQVAISPRQVP